MAKEEPIADAVEVTTCTREDRPVEELIWTRKVQTQVDIAASEDMLEYISSDVVRKSLLDKKTHKAKVWEGVCIYLQDKGYKVSVNVKDGGLKCHQKWRNLERSYTAFISHSGKPEKRPKKPPSFFDQLHAILAQKYHLKSSLLLETGTAKDEEEHPTTSRVSVENSQISVDEESSPPNTSAELSDLPEESCSDSSLRKTTTRKEITPEDIMTTLEKMISADAERFDRVESLLKAQLEEKKRFTDAFIEFMKRNEHCGKKRGQESDSE